MLKILLILFVLLSSKVSVYAQDIITTPYSLGNLKGVNLQADTLYLTASGTFAGGLGTNIATIKDIVSIRVEYVVPVKDTPDRWGGGIGVNIPKLIGKIGGAWLMQGVNANIGVEGLTSKVGGRLKLEPTIYLNVIQVGL
jgi:hypothetical protein